MKSARRSAAAVAAIITAGALASGGMLAGEANAATSFIGPLTMTTQLASTVPHNGDLNPYGVAVVPRSTGDLRAGNVLVSNFNNSQNMQGTGTTVVQVTPGGQRRLFSHIPSDQRGCPGGVGLTTALVVLRSGWVIVGSLPTLNGMSATINGPGCLLVLNSAGRVAETISGGGINGPWDMTALDRGHIAELFVTNVLNGTVAHNGGDVSGGTVLRLVVTSSPFSPPRVLSDTQIGSGFTERTDPAALVVGPTGVGLGRDGTLYVADTANSRIAAIPHATTRLSDDGDGRTVTQGGDLMNPLGLVVAPDGDILTVNAANGNIVETTPHGFQIAQATIDHNNGGGGNLFGLAIKPGHHAVYFVDDFNNTLDLFF